jgi:nickel-type superoxide dismutase maturation protease
MLRRPVQSTDSWRWFFPAIVVTVAVLVVARIRRVVVTGDSMLPAFEPGDRLLVGPVGRLRPGQVVAVRDPRRPDRLLIKRIRTVTPDARVDVRGDNEPASTDSRHFGPVDRGAVRGRVLYRYGPAARAGRWPGSLRQ